MSRVYQPLQHCLLCRDTDVETVLSLHGLPVMTPNADVPEDFADAPDLYEVAPLNLVKCASCGHLQVSGMLDPNYLYRSYVYTTSLSVGLRDHFRSLVDDILSHAQPPEGGLVVEFGSNDGTLLKLFQDRGLKVLGIDPARAIAERATQEGVETQAEFFGPEVALRIRASHGAADVIVANNVIANIEDLPSVAEGVAALLAPNGTFTFETQYGVDVIEKNLLDTIYHEHLSYFLIRPLRTFFQAHRLEIVDVVRNASKGGSIRVLVQHQGGPQSVAPTVSDLVAAEERAGFYDQDLYDRYRDRLAVLRRQLTEFIAERHAKGQRVAGYGASIGTVTLLHQLGLQDKIDFLIDHDPAKSGSNIAGPGYSLQVLPPQAVTDQFPSAILVFAWRYADGIKQRHDDYIAAGGAFYLPVPDLTRVG